MEMKRKSNVSILLYVLLLISPFLVSLMVYNQLPEQVVTHWNINQVPDGYSSKAFAAFGLPAFFAIVNMLVFAGLRFDPKSGNIGSRFKGVFRWVLACFTFVVHGIVISYALGFRAVNISVMIIFIVGILFAVLGNYFPKSKQNYTAGIRLPWTLANEVNWNKTHRLAGYLWVIGGVIMCITSFLAIPWILITIIAVLVIVPVGYSFFLYATKRDVK